MIYLASQSARRQTILKQYGIAFTVIPQAMTDEYAVWNENLSVCINAQQVALEKATQSQGDGLHHSVLSCDTVVYIDDCILTKPTTQTKAIQYLHQLSNRIHHVVTAFAIIFPDTQQAKTGYDHSLVQFNPLSDHDIRAYLNQTMVTDKAGGYGIQTVPPHFVNHIQGSYATIMGLPIEKLYPILSQHVKYTKNKPLRNAL